MEKYKITIFNVETFNKRNIIVIFKFDSNNHCWTYTITDFVGTTYERTGTEQYTRQSPKENIERFKNNTYLRKNEYINVKQLTA